MSSLPFSEEVIVDAAAEFPTPFYLYDETGIRENAQRLIKAFDWCDFKEFFAVKATPNPAILKALAEEGCGADCSSLAELVLCERIGIRGEEIIFTSNDTPAKDFEKAVELGAIINLDDISHIDYLDQICGLPELLCFRYNPGKPLGSDTAFIIGEPQEAKYGFTRDQLFAGFEDIRRRGVKRFGLHTMVLSNELNSSYFAETAKMIFEVAVDLKKELDLTLEFVNLGGGLGVPYRPEQEPIDLQTISDGIRQLQQQMLVPAGLGSMRICMENGRVMTGPYGVLVTRVLHQKQTYKHYVGVDACMANLMRPGMYGAYHHLSVMGKPTQPDDAPCDVVGSLCENNDKFAIDRPLPAVETGDIIAIHDAGAHGHSMGFQYNGKLRSAEYLRTTDGTIKQIRRAETLDDYFATLDLPTQGQ
ncbi:Diaminopimelate decarboxylase [Roseimaritima multifibrata]|uniref:Diaminopimelate decarboxylase n=1 Tax=Roseimaritima multifibrata TaxID=1930274 RepID=A0A517MBT6_9BACT|nr:diaminopimelate decarboxylase [Roseimaritima multifibrata]QDS92350.1 Diaminopimelate decarboxylase [Roseimaritima multifibrata]